MISCAKVGSLPLPPKRFSTEISTDLLKNRTFTATVSVARPLALPSQS